MADGWSGSSDLDCQSDDSYIYGSRHIEPIYDAFICPLTKEVMRDPVTLENGQTFEREAIEKWFRECRENGRRPMCPLTSQELKTTELNPSIALRNTIEEWCARNEAVQLDIVKKVLHVESPEKEVWRSLRFIQQLCQKRRTNKRVILNAELIPKIVDMLKSGSKRVRYKALETLRIVVEGSDDNKEALAEGNNVRTIVKFLSHEHSQERQEAVSLLYELSTSESMCEKIGAVNGAILLLVGLSSSKSENVSTIDKAERTLENLENCETNVKQMAENGRLEPLLKLLLEGSTETKIDMATYLSEIPLTNDVKVLVARRVGVALVNIMGSGSPQARESALKALNQVSSCEAGSKILIEAGVLPPLVKDLFTVGFHHLPMKLKEVSATVLANIVSSGFDFDSIPLGPDGQTLVSEDIVHNLLHLISNTGPAIEAKLLQVLVGLTGSSATVDNVVNAIRSSGATISLIQFIEAPQRELRLAALKLLSHLSTHMGQDLADGLRATTGQLSGLFRLISLDGTGVTEEQAAAIGVLAYLPSEDSNLTRRLLDEGIFKSVIDQLNRIQLGDVRGGRFVTPYTEGLVSVLSRITYVLQEEPDAVTFAQEHNLASLFTDQLQANGLDEVQRVSALALKNLSAESKRLSRQPEVPTPGLCASVFFCFNKPPSIIGLCRLHHGICSFKESFCLLEGKHCISKLVSRLDHRNEMVAQASLEALCTLISDSVDVEQGVQVLCEAESIKEILEILHENKTEGLRHHAVWAVERLLRFEDIAYEMSNDPNVSSALVDAFKHGDFRTRQIAERALKHIDRIPNFSSVFPKPPR
ncbi:U-box domain-containing protein 43 [Nymphaea thermarum]|nr:U-box domain-containing protein 43 [Nymphaea thermarum]